MSDGIDNDAAKALAARWAKEDDADERLRGERWGGKPRWRKLRWPSPEFVSAVTKLYRGGTAWEIALAEKAERLGYLAEQISPPVSIGGLASVLIKRMPKRQAKSDSCLKSQNVAPVKKARRWLGLRSA